MPCMSAIAIKIVGHRSTTGAFIKTLEEKESEILSLETKDIFETYALKVPCMGLILEQLCPRKVPCLWENLKNRAERADFSKSNNNNKILKMLYVYVYKKN